VQAQQVVKNCRHVLGGGLGAYSENTARRHSYHQETRPGCDQQDHADGEDHRPRDGNRDPAEFGTDF
jgi:hypothetical protein